jgi:hypothetical protein
LTRIRAHSAITIGAPVERIRSLLINELPTLDAFAADLKAAAASR